jgi:hypothetical protein
VDVNGGNLQLRKLHPSNDLETKQSPDRRHGFFSDVKIGSLGFGGVEKLWRRGKVEVGVEGI